MAQFVKDVMTPAIASVSPDASLVEAAQLMRSQDIGDVLIAEDGRLLGVLTDRDIALRAVADGVDPLTVSCHSVCTREPVTVGPEEEVRAAVRLMREHSVRRLPVVEDGRPLGVISIGDLSREQDPGSTLADISRASPNTLPGIASA
ncbi:CBS domain-containing protein [Streptomyces sp. NPDC057654]|uniref:CBS domain-containing protein n=1 Tax=Streptomyces sp. NPDC057654 TaxID=3346196 RepID=UPI0036A16D68